MKIQKEIKVTGTPTGIIMSEDQRSIFYYDPVNLRIYRVLLVDKAESPYLKPSQNGFFQI